MSAQFRRFGRPFAKKGAKAIFVFAVVHTLVVMVWHVLANDGDYSGPPTTSTRRNESEAHARRPPTRGRRHSGQGRPER